MKSVRLEFISDGFKELLMSDEIGQEVENAAQKIANQAMRDSNSERKRGAQTTAEYIVKGPLEGSFGGGRQIAYVAAADELSYVDAVYHHRLETAVWEVAE